MVQARDELFLKLALRQGLFTQQEAREFLIRYRSEGGAREGVGHWLVAEGILGEEQAALIRNAIAHRAEGHVDPKRRRVPKRAGGGGGGGHPAPHHPIRHHRQPRGIKVTGAQQALYIGAGVLTVVIAIGLVFAYQNRAAERRHQQENPTTATNAATETNTPTADETAIKNASAIVATPEWTDQERESMLARLKTAEVDALSHVGDGNPGKGVARVNSELEKMGEKVPPEVQTAADTVLQMLRDACDAKYAELFTELQAARKSDAEDDVADIILQIEETCGKEYGERARGGGD